MSLSYIFRRPSCATVAARLAFRPRTYATKTVKPVSKGPPGVKKASSCAPDTVIVGANYLKGQPPVLALPDEEYPEWLWRVLEKREWPDDGPGGRGERAARRAANKMRIRDANFMATQ
ncbi:mitochondrial ribosomal protein L37-domain-containing protein [Mycena latifolia]|nr:mitochondrial ribosomal protein L37-domain-containing protein [Mycena latifolia]